MMILGVATTAKVPLNAARVALLPGTRQTTRRPFLSTPALSSPLPSSPPLFWLCYDLRYCSCSRWPAAQLKATKPNCLPTRVVFDGEVWVVEHLWDQAVVEEVALDRVVSIHRADYLDHLR